MISKKGNNTYNIGEYGVEAENGSAIDITGGKVNTSYLVANENTKITANKADISAREGIWASGKNAIVTLDGMETNTYTVEKGIIAENGGKIYINGGTLTDNALRTKMYKVQDAEEKKSSIIQRLKALFSIRMVSFLLCLIRLREVRISYRKRIRCYYQ